MRQERKDIREPRFPGRDEKTEACPDCNVDDRIDGMNHPRKGRAPWSEPAGSLAKGKQRGCQTCGGTGRVPKEKREGRFTDDYEVLDKSTKSKRYSSKKGGR